MNRSARNIAAVLGCLLALGWTTSQAQEKPIELIGLTVAGAEFTGSQ
jgi:hypothetical protein